MIHYKEKVDDPSQGGFFDFVFTDIDRNYRVVENEVSTVAASLMVMGLDFNVSYVSREDGALEVSVEWGDQVGRASRGELGPEAG